MVSLLIQHAWFRGDKLVIDDAKREPGHPKYREGSFHNYGLAVDMLLYVDGIYRRDGAAYEPYGVYWESLGGTWGGRFDQKPGDPVGRDADHFSYLEGKR